MNGVIVGLACYFGQPCQLVLHVCGSQVGPSPAVVHASPWLALAVSPKCQWTTVPPPPTPNGDAIAAAR